MRRKAAIILACWVFLVLAGCWDQRELNDLAITTVEALDLEATEGKTKVIATFQFANPQVLSGQRTGTGGGDKEPFYTATGLGETVRDAAREMENRVPKRLFFGHHRLTILGEAAAREGVRFLLDGIYRFREPRGNMYLAVSRGMARDVIEVESSVFSQSGVSLSGIFDNTGGVEEIYPVVATEFAYKLTTGTWSPVLPVIEITPARSRTITSVEKGKDKTTLRINGLGVFNNMGRLLGFFDRNETKALGLVLNKVKSRTVIVEGALPGSTVALGAVENQGKVSCHFEGGNPVFEVKVRQVCDLWEYFGDGSDLTNPEFVEMLERRASTRVENEIKRMLEHSRSLGADVLGLGQAMHRRFPGEFRRMRDKWQEIYPEVEVRVSCTTSLRHRGLSVEGHDHWESE